MPLTLNNTNTLTADNIIIGGTDLSTIYATKTELASAGGGISQTEFDNSIATLNAKDISYNNTINTHISLIDTNTTDIASNTASISTLNTKNLDNFNAIGAINTNLSTNYQTSTQLATNYYNKTETDNKIDNLAVYSQTEVDAFLSYKEDKSRFEDNISFFPIIDCSRPTILHQGLTLKNSTISIEPLEGALFSNQFGAEADRDVAIFKNKSNYITLKGNKIIANATSDDALTTLDLNPSDNVKIANLIVGDITVPDTGSDIIRNIGDANYTLRVRDTQAVWEFRNRNFRCMNPSNPANGTEMIIHDTGGDYRLRIGSQTNAQVGIGVQYNSSYFLNVGGLSNFNEARVATDLEVVGDLNLGGATANINNANGINFYKNTNDASDVFRVGNDVAYMLFRAWFIDCKRASDDTDTTLYLQWNSGGDVQIGNSSAQVAIATTKNPSFNLNVGGSSQFEIIRASNYIWAPTGAYYLNTDMKMYQRADANKSLNIITSNEINFSLQSNKEADPTTATIALQLNDTNGITINRAVVNNLTFNSIGNIVGEADIISWGRFMFQNASEFKEVLDGQYKLFVRNGDMTGSINLTVGLEATTPEIKITNDNVNLLGHLDITHSTVSTSERVKMDNPDADGLIFHSINGANILEVSSTGVYVNGALDNSSDVRLKENIKEVNNKTFVDMVKYIKPKEFKYIDKDEKHIGFVADDVLNSKMPKHWHNIVHKGSEGYLRMDYSKMVVPLWGCVQSLLSEVEDLKKEIKKLKKDNKDSDDENASVEASRGIRDKPKPKAKAKSK